MRLRRAVVVVVVIDDRHVAVVKHHLAALSANRRIWRLLRRRPTFNPAANRLVDYVELK